MNRGKLVAFALFLAAAYAGSRLLGPGVTVEPKNGPHPSNPVPAISVAAPASGSILQGSGTVTRLLADDNDGSRHQRFILRLPSGQTVLVAHNIDLAPRVDALAVGDTVEFKGEFENNPQGGVVHWTHRDPQGRHTDGWLRHRGREYR